MKSYSLLSLLVLFLQFWPSKLIVVTYIQKPNPYETSSFLGKVSDIVFITFL